MNVDRIEAILRLLQRQEHVGELSVRGSGWRLTARKGPSMPPAPPEALIVEEEVPSAPLPITIVAERVGIYRAPKTPLRRGDWVDRGAAVGSIDSMRILNPITAGEAGCVVEARVEDGDAVEFGQTLFLLSAEPLEEEDAVPEL